MSKIKTHLPSSVQTHTICISKAARVSELLARVSEKWGNITPARFWHAQVNFLEQDPIDGVFYSSSRIENDSTQPFATTEEDKKKRLDEAGLEDGDAIIMETKEWTMDLETTTLGQRINRPKAQNPRVAVFTEEQLAKYRSHRALSNWSGMKNTPSEVYPPRDGDITIRTSDNILFGVHRFLLKLASPTISDILTIGGEKSANQKPGTSCLSLCGWTKK